MLRVILPGFTCTSIRQASNTIEVMRMPRDLKGIFTYTVGLSPIIRYARPTTCQSISFPNTLSRSISPTLTPDSLSRNLSPKRERVYSTVLWTAKPVCDRYSASCSH
jgi:hypothetical protein